MKAGSTPIKTSAGLGGVGPYIGHGLENAANTCDGPNCDIGTTNAVFFDWIIVGPLDFCSTACYIEWIAEGVNKYNSGQKQTSQTGRRRI